MSFKRVNPGDPITAAMWNALVDEINRLGNLSVAPPLSLSDTGAGLALSVDASDASDDADVVVQIDTTATPGGKYEGFFTNPPTTNYDPASGDLATTDIADSIGDACHIINLAEEGASGHLIDPSDAPHYVGRIIGTDPDDGLSIVAIRDEIGKGTLKYQCFSMDSAGTQRVWDYPRFPL